MREGLTSSLRADHGLLERCKSIYRCHHSLAALLIIAVVLSINPWSSPIVQVVSVAHGSFSENLDSGHHEPMKTSEICN